MTKKKILLTGANGFLGKAASKQLIQNNYEVLALSRNDIEPSSKGLKWLKCDLSDNEMSKKLPALISDIEYVIHAAAQMPMGKEEDPYLFINNNINATINLLEALPPNIKHFIYCSSTDVYGIQSRMPINEHNLLQPLTYYGATKLFGEYLIKIYFSKKPTVVTHLRFTQLYGPKEPKIKIIPRLIECIITKKEISIDNEGEDTRDYLFIEDAADAVIECLTKSLDGVFNVSSAKAVTVKFVIQLLEHIAYERLKVNYLPKTITSNYVFDNSKFCSATNWRPKIDLIEGIKKQYEFASKNYLKIVSQ